jgi:hypothetical protein
MTNEIYLSGENPLFKKNYMSIDFQIQTIKNDMDHVLLQKRIFSSWTTISNKLNLKDQTNL